MSGFSGAAVDQTAWTAYACTLTPGSGAFGSAPAPTVVASYKKLTAKTVAVDISIVFPAGSNGTAAAYILADLPLPTVRLGSLSGAALSSGGGLACSIDHTNFPNKVFIMLPGTGYPGGDNARLAIQGVYETP